jgi:hypothetical protein
MSKYIEGPFQVPTLRRPDAEQARMAARLLKKS